MLSLRNVDVLLHCLSTTIIITSSTTTRHYRRRLHGLVRLESVLTATPCSLASRFNRFSMADTLDRYAAQTGGSSHITPELSSL